METRIVEIAERIKGLREMMDITPEEMAEAAGGEPCTFLAIVMRRVEEEAEDHENA